MKIREDTIVQPLPDEELIAKKERFWRLRFPEDYRNFLKKYSCGEPEEDAFEHEGHIYAIDRFLGLVRNYKTDVLGCYDIGVVESQIEERLTDNRYQFGMDVIPIAALFAGNYLCLDFRGYAENPTVCIWFHEESGDFDPCLEKVADSFTEFTEMLIADEDE